MGHASFMFCEPVWAHQQSKSPIAAYARNPYLVISITNHSIRH